MKRRIKSVLLSSISVMLLATTITLSAVSCSSNTKQVNSHNQESSATMINLQNGQKINYVAFGDSITAGFDAKYDYGLGGYYDPINNEVYGLGYPSFLMRYFQSYNKNCIASFNNFAISGSTISDWLYLLGVKELNNKPLTNNSTFTVNVDNQQITLTRHSLQQTYNHFLENAKTSPISVVQKRLSTYFGDSNTSINNQFFISAIKKANLITFSLGANDFFATGLFNEAFSVLSQNIANWSSLSMKLNQVFKLISEYLVLLFKQLRTLNPDAYINAISYPMPIIRIANLIDYYFHIPNSDQAFSDYLLNNLNDCIKNAVILFNRQNPQAKPVAYINVFNSELWQANAQYYDEDLYSIHPTVIGYRQIAKTIFLKLTLQKTNVNNLHQLLNTWSTSYINSDFNLYKQEVCLNNDLTNQQLINYVNKINIINDPIALQTQWAQYANQSVADNIVYHSFVNRNFFFLIANTLYLKFFKDDDYNQMIYHWLELNNVSESANWYTILASIFGAQNASNLFINFLNFFTNYFKNTSQITNNEFIFALKKLICNDCLLNNALNTIFNLNLIKQNLSVMSQIYLADFLNLKNNTLLNLYKNELTFLYPQILGLLTNLFSGESSLDNDLSLDNDTITQLSFRQLVNLWLKKKIKAKINLFLNIFINIFANLSNLYQTYLNSTNIYNYSTLITNPAFQKAFRVFNLLNIILKNYGLINEYKMYLFYSLYDLLKNRSDNVTALNLFINGLYGYKSKQTINTQTLLNASTGILGLINLNINNDQPNQALIQSLIDGYYFK